MKFGKPILSPAPCIPSHLTFECRTCARLSGNEAFTTQFPVIDATKADWPDGVCPMFMAVAMKEAA
jgi:hypothetical protein